MSELNIENMSEFYPMFDEERMEQVLPASEMLCWHDMHSFFSPSFKTSNIIIDYILKKYHYTDSRSEKNSRCKGLITCHEMQRKPNLYNRCLNKFKKIDADQQTGLKCGNIIAYFEDQNGTKCIFMLTKDRLLSDYQNDNGRYTNFQIKDIEIRKSGIYNTKADCLINGISFSEAFIDLFHEIKLLGKTIEIKKSSHPIQREGRMTRIRYLEILIDKCFYDGYLTADEVIRIEIMARQFGISSSIIREKMSESKDHIKSKPTYLEWSVQKINDIPQDYFYSLVQDLIVFEVEFFASGYGNGTKNEFLKHVSVRCGYENGIVEKWFQVIRNFVQSSYNFRKMKEDINNNNINTADRKKINDAVTYEYHMQESMLRR